MAGKKILFLCGSPRAKGNTATVVNWAAEGARQAGATVEVADASRLNYAVKGCVACMRCQNSPHFGCTIDDDASRLLLRVPEQDVFVLATPVYFMGFSAQLKLVIDRMFSLIKIKMAENRIEHALSRTDLALIATAGGDEGSGLHLVKQNLEQIAGFLGKTPRILSVPLAPQDSADTAARTDLRDRALAFGRQLATA